ncbi:TPA: hypothetical protein N2Q63_004703 [Citrobacter freundii]|uniref:hypothetical protein n=1 Tax=Leclercia adecarboxylata TaxID=83655 RepID=UPI001F2AB69A|nr:hypothetical protein [Leclercia adecarboxylata]HCL6635059.1 hypothetical protein [Citrobacter freundii]MCE9982447.1 hypothetical protein [Leclercia adecarboxylata]MDH0062583.1 hypothetical protein [Leclercia adecarboxylata]HCL6759646.1 hypothetical protein [Citrobacter freundii]HED2424942.1 hypothetical protein [Citrobacter freundii]
MSDLKVVPFSGKAQSGHDSQEVIRLLEEALQMAREGSCHSLAVIMLSNDGGAIDCWHSGGRPYVMVGAIEALKTDFIHSNIEGR